MYMEITGTFSTALETFDQPRDIYPNYPVRVGTLQINDTVLAPFSSDYSLGKVTAVKDWLTGRYEIQPGKFSFKMISLGQIFSELPSGKSDFLNGGQTQMLGGYMFVFDNSPFYLQILVAQQGILVMLIFVTKVNYSLFNPSTPKSDILILPLQLLHVSL